MKKKLNKDKAAKARMIPKIAEERQARSEVARLIPWRDGQLREPSFAANSRYLELADAAINGGTKKK